MKDNVIDLVWDLFPKDIQANILKKETEQENFQKLKVFLLKDLADQLFLTFYKPYLAKYVEFLEGKTEAYTTDMAMDKTAAERYKAVLDDDDELRIRWENTELGFLETASEYGII